MIVSKITQHMNKCRTIFNIYIKNPDVCRLVILREDDKILGRALVWKLVSIRSGVGEKFEGVEYFMDRQYTIKDSDVNKFRNFAKEQGWIYKTNNNHHSFTNITYNGSEINVDMVVQVARYLLLVGLLLDISMNGVDIDLCLVLDEVLIDGFEILLELSRVGLELVTHDNLHFLLQDLQLQLDNAELEEMIRNADRSGHCQSVSQEEYFQIIKNSTWI